MTRAEEYAQRGSGQGVRVDSPSVAVLLSRASPVEVREWRRSARPMLVSLGVLVYVEGPAPELKHVDGS